jgi:predicted RNA-binding Zn-ribbon protein involved in translation (DUF1610 family)
MKEKQRINQTDRGWVDLSNLIYFNSGNMEMVDWGKSIGKTVDFQYDDVVATLTVTERADNIQYVYIDVPGYVEHHKIYVGQIRHGQLGCVVKKITSDFKYEIGDIVNGLLITSRRKVPKYKYYSYTCMNDGYNGEIREDHLTSGHRCPVCTNKVVLVGYNDIATTNSDMAKLFYNIDDASKYMEHSNQYADFRCPRCGNKIHARINSVASDGLSCKKCGDGISYPNKFVYNFVEQLSFLCKARDEQFEFTPEKKFPWSMNFEHKNQRFAGKKIYDMFIHMHNIIIENHGDYHYERGFGGIESAYSLEEVQANDDIKRNLAISNGIAEDHYIILNCHKSEMEYIKKVIMSSNLPTLLNFTESDIDWKKCDEFATSSRVYEACCYWNNGFKDYKQIALLMKMHHGTIARYIHKGRELNIIND